VKIVIADQHRIVAEALARLLSLSRHEIAGCVAGLDTAAAAVHRGQADACVLDLDLPGMREAGALRRVVAGAPGTAFVVLAASAGPGDLSRVVAVGVHGFALKTDDFAEFLRVLNDAARWPARSPGGTTVLSLSAQVLSASRRKACGEQPLPMLTDREHEVLARLVRGQSTTSMARSMGVRLSTARSHVDAVLIKLGAHSRLEAVACAVREGLVDIDEPGTQEGWGDGRACALSG
jgi:two-component system, NarL family, nitrate/nitrite response regulator NarL